MRSNLNQTRAAKARSGGKSIRLIATFLTVSVTRHLEQLHAGKNAKSPGPSRRSAPPSGVTKTSPDMMTHVSSTSKCVLNDPTLHSQTTTQFVLSRLFATSSSFGAGEPAKRRSGAIRIGCGAALAAVPITVKSFIAHYTHSHAHMRFVYEIFIDKLIVNGQKCLKCGGAGKIRQLPTAAASFDEVLIFPP